VIDERLLSVAPSPAFWVAVAAYAAATACLFAALAGATRFRAAALWLVGLAFVAHGADIGWRGTEHVHPAESVREAIGFLAFIITGGYLLASARYRMTLGGVVVMPVSLVLLLLARLTPAGTSPGDDLSTLGRVHISLATIGVAVFAVAGVLSAVYLVEDRALKRKRFDTLALEQGGAPLEPLDKLAHRLVWVGFPIFTLAMILGAIWTARLGESVGRIEYALATVTWVAFATLLVARQIYGWRGKRAAKLTLEGFASALAVLVVYLIRRIVE
jgi:ABC-type uncharacterized transport system permease subunit